MPVACKVISRTSTPFKMPGQGSTCVAAVEGPKSSSILNFRVQDAMSMGFGMSGEAPKVHSNCRLISAHDAVMHGLSALSLHGAHYHRMDVNAAPLENQSISHGVLCHEAPDAYRCMSMRDNEGLPTASSPLAVCGHFKGKSSLWDMDSVQGGEVFSEAFGNGSGCVLHFGASHLTTPSPYCCQPSSVTLPGKELQSSSSIFSNSSSSESVLRTDNFELDTISESSTLSNNGMLAAGSSSGEVSQVVDDSEVQSPYKGGNVSFVEEPPNLPRRGLSQFYVGRSRSFSCLRDVASVKNLAKPESPYSKKRKVISNSSRLPPLQKGSATISKRLSQSGKSTLAMAVAMNAKENEPQFSNKVLASLVPSRSYSLSDLQGAAR